MSIRITDSFSPELAAPLDTRTVFSTVAEALANIPIPVRYRGLQVYIENENNGTNYWFKEGVANSDFIPVETGGQERPQSATFYVAAGGTGDGLSLANPAPDISSLLSTLLFVPSLVPTELLELKITPKTAPFILIDLDSINIGGISTILVSSSETAAPVVFGECQLKGNIDYVLSNIKILGETSISCEGKQTHLILNHKGDTLLKPANKPLLETLKGASIEVVDPIKLNGTGTTPIIRANSGEIELTVSEITTYPTDIPPFEIAEKGTIFLTKTVADSATSTAPKVKASSGGTLLLTQASWDNISSSIPEENLGINGVILDEETSETIAGFGEAPSDSVQYARYNKKWEPIKEQPKYKFIYVRKDAPPGGTGLTEDDPVSILPMYLNTLASSPVNQIPSKILIIKFLPALNGDNTNYGLLDLTDRLLPSQVLVFADDMILDLDGTRVGHGISATITCSIQDKNMNDPIQVIGEDSFLYLRIVNGGNPVAPPLPALSYPFITVSDYASALVRLEAETTITCRGDHTAADRFTPFATAQTGGRINLEVFGIEGPNFGPIFSAEDHGEIYPKFLGENLTIPARQAPKVSVLRGGYISLSKTDWDKIPGVNPDDIDSGAFALNGLVLDEKGNTLSGFGEAPADGNSYVRKDNKWVQIRVAGPTEPVIVDHYYAGTIDTSLGMISFGDGLTPEHPKEKMEMVDVFEGVPTGTQNQHHILNDITIAQRLPLSGNHIFFFENGSKIISQDGTGVFTSLLGKDNSLKFYDFKCSITAPLGPEDIAAVSLWNLDGFNDFESSALFYFHEANAGPNYFDIGDRSVVYAYRYPIQVGGTIDFCGSDIKYFVFGKNSQIDFKSLKIEFTGLPKIDFWRGLVLGSGEETFVQFPILSEVSTSYAISQEYKLGKGKFELGARGDMGALDKFGNYNINKCLPGGDWETDGSGSLVGRDELILNRYRERPPLYFDFNLGDTSDRNDGMSKLSPLGRVNFDKLNDILSATADDNKPQYIYINGGNLISNPITLEEIHRPIVLDFENDILTLENHQILNIVNCKDVTIKGKSWMLEETDMSSGLASIYSVNSTVTLKLKSMITIGNHLAVINGGEFKIQAEQAGLATETPSFIPESSIGGWIKAFGATIDCNIGNFILQFPAVNVGLTDFAENDITATLILLFHSSINWQINKVNTAQIVGGGMIRTLVGLRDGSTSTNKMPGAPYVVEWGDPNVQAAWSTGNYDDSSYGYQI